MLKPGEYDVWASKIEAHVMSIDAQCWKIILEGDEKIIEIMARKEEAKPLASYKEEDHQGEVGGQGKRLTTRTA